MADGLSRRLPAAMEAVGGVKRSAKEESVDDSVMADDLDVNLEAEVSKLRGHWELASVLNFLNVSLFSCLRRLHSALENFLSCREDGSALDSVMVMLICC